jgi:hypothetical protein
MGEEKSIDQQRVDIERERLTLEKTQFEAQKTEQERNERFFRKHAGETLAGAITLAGILVSVANIWVAYIQKDKEIELQRAQKDKEIEFQRAQKDRELELADKAQVDGAERATRDYEYKWKLDMLQFVDKHGEQIFSTEQKDVERMRSIMLVSFPAEHVSSLFDSLGRTARTDAQKKAWQEGQEIANKLVTDNKQQWAVVEATKPLADAPPQLSSGRVPITATQCTRFEKADALPSGKCRVSCWDKEQKTRFNVRRDVDAGSDMACETTALRLCRQAQNSFCAYAWSPPQ